MSASNHLNEQQFSGDAWGSGYQSTRKPENYAARGKSRRAAYGDYLAERESAANTATSTHMVNATGRAKGYDSGSFFHPNASYRPGRKHMTDELRSWMGDPDSATEHGGNGGGLLSFAQWHEQTKQAMPEAS